MKPTYEELEARCERLEELLKKALNRIAELEERLNQNSGNSSRPPSSDYKSNTRKRPSKKRPSRDGFARALIPIEQVDSHQFCELDACPCCGNDALFERSEPTTLQQVELPEARGIVTQYDLRNYGCKSCGSNVQASLPPGVPNSAFGPRLMALMGSLTGVFHLSKDDAKQLLKDLYKIDVSDGSVINIEERVTSALRPVYDRIHHFVTRSVFSKHFDETSWRDRGLTHYVWVAATKQAVCYRIDRHRSRKAFEAIANGLNPNALVVTDRYSAYSHLENPRQFCIPHLIRNVRRFSQRDGPDGVIGLQVEKELQCLAHANGMFRRSEISSASRGQRLRRCRDRLDELLMRGMVEGSKQFGDLCEQLLLDDFEKLWSFKNFQDGDPSNNLAERDLRRVVLWRKKSYGTRSDRGQRFVETITSVASTVRRTGENILDFVTSAVIRYYQGLDAPLIRACEGF